MNQFRKVFIFGSLALLAITLSSCSTSGDKGQQHAIELLSGHGLNGWKAVLAEPSADMYDVWSVRDGILTCKGTPVGFIYRGPEVTDFRLIVEYRWRPGTEPGNSGIFSRIRGDMKSLPKAVEVQLKHKSAGDVLGLQGRKVDSQQSRFFSIKAHPLAGDIAGVKALGDEEKPAGEWNKVEILAVGPRYTVWMNGTVVNEANGVEETAGFVGLQSEGGMIQFRRATLIPLGR